MFGITAVIPTSPIPSHPSTAIIDQTMDSIRFHMPNVPIIVMCDGVRPEQEDISENYDRYIKDLGDRYHGIDYRRVVYFEKFMHQVGMLREVLPTVKTELMLWMEHDTPLVTDEPIDWYGCCAAIDHDDVNMVRFLHEAHIHPEHEYLMRERIYSHGVELRKTTQFSARPHLASVAFYKKLLQRFSPDAKCFIEDKAHSICQDDPWEEWKMSIYSPFGNMKRSLHADGRAGGPKYDDSQIF